MYISEPLPFTSSPYRSVEAIVKFQSSFNAVVVVLLPLAYIYLAVVDFGYLGVYALGLEGEIIKFELL